MAVDELVGWLASVSQALLRLMNQGGPEAQIVLEGMALLGTGQPPTNDDGE